MPETPEETPEQTETPEEAVEETPAPVEEAPPAEEAPVAEQAPAPAGTAPKTARAETRASARQQTASARPSRSPEERQAERNAERRRKAAARTRRRGKDKTKRAAARAEQPAQEQPVHEHGPGRPKIRQGIVTSSKPDKSITVRIDTARRHMRYEKIVRSSSTLHAHDDANDANEGDVVRVVESRPLSRTKRWRLLEVLERAR